MTMRKSLNAVRSVHPLRPVERSGTELAHSDLALCNAHYRLPRGVMVLFSHRSAQFQALPGGVDGVRRPRGCRGVGEAGR